MPDGRFLSKSIAYSAQVGSVSLEADYLFMRMIPHLDSAGRMTGEPMSVKALCCPLRQEITGDVVERCLAELAKARLVRWYEHAGARYVEMPGFAKHQRGARLDREAPSRLPAPRKAKVRTTPENSGERRVSKEKLSEVKRREVKRREESASDTPKRAASKASWLLPICAVWEQHMGQGSFRFSKAGNLLKPLHAAGRSGDEIAGNLGRYFATLNDRKFASIARFAETFAEYGAHTATTDPHERFKHLDGYPDIMRDGWLTPFGEAVTRPEGVTKNPYVS